MTFVVIGTLSVVFLHYKTSIGKSVISLSPDQQDQGILVISMVSVGTSRR